MGRKPKTEIRKREILEHFYHVLIEEGLQGASIAKIAKRMGVHPSLLIHYFSTKEEMVVELVDFILEKYEQAAIPRLAGIKNPRQRLHAVLDMLFGIGWTKEIDQSAFYACYYLSLNNERVKASFDRLYDAFKEMLAEEIKMCVDKGAIKKIDPDKGAYTIIAMMEGLIFLRNTIGDDREYEEIGNHLKGVVLASLAKSGKTVRRTGS